MPNEVKLLPCPFCGEHLIEVPETKLCHRYWEHPDPADGECYLRTETVSDIHVERWNHRPTTVVTDEVVERVAQALESADDAWFEIRPRDRVGTIWQSMARAALASMPTVVTGEQQGELEAKALVRELEAGLFAIADGEGDHQVIARQTLQAAGLPVPE